MKLIISITFLFVFSLSAIAAEPGVVFPDGSTFESGNIIKYNHPDNAFGCELGAQDLDCSGSVIGQHFSLTTKSAEIIKYYDAERMAEGGTTYWYSVYRYQPDCWGGLSCYVPAATEYSNDGKSWSPLP